MVEVIGFYIHQDPLYENIPYNKNAVFRMLPDIFKDWSRALTEIYVVIRVLTDSYQALQKLLQAF